MILHSSKTSEATVLVTPEKDGVQSKNKEVTVEFTLQI